VTPGAEPDVPPTPVEVRLSDLLEPLRANPPQGDSGLASAVARRARWQGGLRGALQVAGTLASAVADAAGLLRPRRGRGGNR